MGKRSSWCLAWSSCSSCFSCSLPPSFSIFVFYTLFLMVIYFVVGRQSNGEYSFWHKVDIVVKAVSLACGLGSSRQNHGQRSFGYQTWDYEQSHLHPRPLSRDLLMPYYSQVSPYERHHSSMPIAGPEYPYIALFDDSTVLGALAGFPALQVGWWIFQRIRRR